ncbi:hypothetical protein DL766_003391 [Monosporascus sp. MC13-8B]|uniref:AB hydrolase-1 domain-containing protein n=1 Tax=Monosporascus cannonballus TaxID=155416 RepID=A0ABY0H2L1_9PEZI|nr:hypothetical protein DL762_006393 [Monosporascus cannonballus]RYP33555.1 hypothetical protein DL766_003391 [Monosporascus sp. MC13-8B]
MITRILSRGLIILSLAATFGAAAPVPPGPRGCSGNVMTRYNPPQKLTWGPCPARFATTPNVTCATYRVPLDWDDPDGTETITLGMLRLAARGGPSRRIGNLFVNPGGPGAQATEVVARLAAAAGQLGPGSSTAELLERFDIVGLDPRGVGLSTPVRCDAGLFNERAPLFPRTPGEFDGLLARNAALGESCRALSGRVVDFVDTVSAARDHEAVRLALGGGGKGGHGDGRASFLGLSYGTQLFSQYAELFPEGVRAMVLDGALQHSQSESSNLLIESAAYETTLQKFFEWCNSTNSSADCVLLRDRGDGGARQVFLDVLAKAGDAPIPAPGCDDGRATACRSSVTEEEARLNAQGLLLETASWPSLVRALLEARDEANATLLSRAQPIAVGDDYEDSYLFGGTAVHCQDWTHATASTWAGITELQIQGAAFAPLTRGASQTYRIQASCAGWPSPQRNPERLLSPYAGEGADVLLVNSVHDPSTSYVWAVGLRAELGERAVLLTRDGAGHTSWSLGGEATDAINRYLVNLTLPEPGTVVDS